MALSLTDVQTFAEIFEGNRSYYGVTIVCDTNKETGKVEAECKLVRKEVTDVLYQRHLLGEISIGIAPINEEGLCYFGAIDIDEKVNVRLIVEAIYRHNFPILPFYSKSGHLHLFVFFESGATPREVTTLLQRYLILFGLSPKTEIFPKQSAPRDTGTYSWINLPYFNADSYDRRKLIDADMNTLSLPAALIRILNNRLPITIHQSILDGYEWIDAPPCLSSSLTLNNITPGHRNEWLFSVGVYLRMKYGEGMEVEDKLKEVNASLSTPLSDRELNNTVLTMMRKETYFYKCSSMDYCNKSACHKCEYGVDSGKATGLEYGQITQVRTDPPYYTWVISGKLLVFYSETDLINQSQFRQLCVRHLHLLPKKVSDEIWSSIVTKALDNVAIEQSDSEDDFTTGSTFLNLLYEYFGDKRQCDSLEGVRLGRVWPDGDKFWFSAQNLLAYIKDNKDFKSFNNVELRTRILDLGGQKQKNSLWTIPKWSVEGGVNPDMDNIDMSDPDNPINNKEF